MSDTTDQKTQPGAPHARASTFQILAMVRRQFRSGLSDFSAFILCIALGVMAITAVGALSDSMRNGLERQGREILGGDILLKRIHTQATKEERALLDTLASVSETAGMRATASNVDGSQRTMVELKGIDKSYPMVGTLKLHTPATTTSDDNKQRAHHALAAAIHVQTGAAVDPLLLERLNIKLGDKLKIGNLDVEITATIDKIPDALSGRLSYGPAVLVSLATLKATGLVQPGTLIRWRYAMLLPASPNDDAALTTTRAKLKQHLTGHGFITADKRDPAPEIRKALDRLRQFLTLVGLTALLVGGVGVANAVTTYIDKSRKTIATLKSIGATGAQVFMIFLAQVIAVATIGIVLGLATGVMVPALINWLFAATLPINLTPALSLASLATASTYGILVSLLFSIWPLGRLSQVRPAVLFRDEVAEASPWPSPAIIAATLLLAAALAALAIFSTDARKLAIYFCLATLVIFAVFIALGFALTWLARVVPHPSNVSLAIALRALSAPGGMTRSVVLSLGTGLSVLVAVAIADASFRQDLESRLPDSAPDYFVLDLPSEDLTRFKETVAARLPTTSVRDAPMLRGRLVKLAGRPVEEIKPPPDAQWVLNGDRGITYSHTVPDGSKLVQGDWWADDYSGNPLVSFEADLAKKLDLKIGDTLTVNILGRDITATIANLRKVDWDSLAINFVLVFSPNTLEGAPINRLATMRFQKGTSLRDEARLMVALGKEFPTTTQIRVKDAINAFNTIFKKVMAAVRVAGGLTLLAGAIVLAGALATSRRRRVRDAVILKTLGATRSRILKSHLIEYMIIAFATAGAAIVLGASAATLVLTHVMDTPVFYSPMAIIQAVALALALVVIFGSLGTWSVLKTRPVQYLRQQ